MRNIRTIFFVFSLIFVVGALAQQPTTHENSNQSQGAVEHGQRGQMATPEAQLRRLTEELSLSESQQTAVKAILDDAHKQAETIRGDNALSPEDRMAKMRTLHESAHGKIRDILNADQKKKFDEMQTRMDQHMNEKNPSKNPTWSVLLDLGGRFLAASFLTGLVLTGLVQRPAALLRWAARV
jgi:hypothetical protein